MSKAIHHSVVGPPPTSNKGNPFDWATSTIVATRTALHESVSSTTPTITTGSVNLSFMTGDDPITAPFVLPGIDNSFGLLVRTSSSTQTYEYCIFDNDTLACTRTGVSFNRSDGRVNISKDGKLIFTMIGTSDGIYTVNQDGSGLTKIGSVSGSATNHGVSTNMGPDGTLYAVRNETTAITKVTPDYSISTINISGVSYFQFSGGFITEDWLVGQDANSVLYIFPGDLSRTTPLRTVTPGSYATSSRAVPSINSGEFLWGADCKGGGNKAIGVVPETGTLIRSNIFTGYVEQTASCNLPTGEFLGYKNYHNGDGSSIRGNRFYLFDPYSNQIQMLYDIGGSSAVYYRTPLVLSNGKVLSLHGSPPSLEYVLFDFGFTKKQVPMNMLISPLGFNPRNW